MSRRERRIMKAVEMRAQNMKMTEIAKKLHVHPVTVSAWLRKHKGGTPKTPKPATRVERAIEKYNGFETTISALEAKRQALLIQAKNIEEAIEQIKELPH
jgi:transposase